MKKLITAIFILVAANTLFCQQTEFPRGVFLFGDTNVDFEQMRDSLFINYIQGYASELSTIPPIVTNDGDLNVLAGSRLLLEPSSAQKLIFEAELEYGQPLTYAYWENKLTGQPSGNAWQCIRNTHIANYMVRDAAPDNEYRYDRTDYTATFRMQISKDLTGNPPVADLVIYCKTHSNELARITLRYLYFLNHEVYQDFDVPFILQTNPASPQSGEILTGGDESLIPSAVTCENVDIRVYWHGLVTTWLDYAIVMDNPGSVLFAGGYDAVIDSEATPFVNDDYPLVKRFYTKDEPHISAFLSYNYVDNKFISLNPSGLNEGRGRAITAMHQGYSNALWFIQNAQPYEYFFDSYVIHSDIPSPSMTDVEAISVGVVPYQNNAQQYTTLIQPRLSLLVTRLNPIIEHCKNNDIPLWYVPQLHGVYLRDTQEYRDTNGDAQRRPPTGGEIWATSNIAIAYGAAGIFPYPQGTHFYSANGIDYVFPGLVSQDPYNGKLRNHWGRNTVIDGKTVFTGYSEKWDALASLNQKLISIGDELLSLSWEGAKSWHNETTSGNWSGIISNVTSNYTETKYIETGQFINASGIDYFFVVNRRTLSSENRNITVTFNKSSSYSTWKVTEAGTNNFWILSKTGYFTTNYEPGEGKLFKFEPMFLNDPETLSGNIIIATTITVPSGKTLNIQEGSNLYCNEGISILVDGTLNAVGASNEPITFTSISDTLPGSWGSIIFDGSAASSSIIDNAEIMYASDMQCLNGADVTIQNSLIDHCTQGIYIYNSQPRILNNQIIEPTQNGIYGEAPFKQPLIQGNEIIRTSGTSYQGIIFGNYTRPFITHNDISGFSNAIYLGGGTYTYFTDDNYYTFYPNNRLRYSIYGLVTGWGSLTIGGNYFAGYNNSIYSNAVWDVYSYQHSTVFARLNYWGGGSPKKSVDGTSVLYTDPYLDSDPWEGSSAPISNQGDVKDLANFIPESGSDPMNDPNSDIEDLIAGIILEKDGRIIESVLHYKQMIDRNVFVRPALTSLASIASEYDGSDLINYFEELVTNRAELKAILLNLLAAMHLHRGNYNKTLKLYDEIIMEYGDDYEGVSARLDKFFAVINYGKNITGAANLLLEIESLDITDQELLIRKEFANYLLNGTAKLNKGTASANNSTNDNGLPKEFALFDNYPNPFNPTTTIEYAIPKASFVVLKIYDILGGEVASLVKENKPSGNHSVKFNASNLPSGIYFYRIVSGKFSATKKLILLK